ncbi:hypothetical protein [Macrococcoides canis]|uniref:hypothetical protein n=1 Tax=Macrococcoides canis TaxID=1855823 RepID=UPI0013051E38|nr:hypothetical protein [Macrococcus canis]QTQ07208.1 hypothetical protein J9174_07080 [Macrococcus canis]QUR95464.1 hypothetical protein GOY09_11155 [Macrococcus canis]UTH01453.1 hypothetical protein KFV05_06890 [Macrococcus canis]UTH05993.1 hypothetical protein KFV07_07290 [Macrococcus canis]
MKRYSGFLLIDSMFAFSIIILIVMLLIPMYQEMSITYHRKQVTLEKIRLMYTHIVIREGEYTREANKICIKASELCHTFK